MAENKLEQWSTENQETWKENCYILLWGGDESMKKRVEAVAKEIKNNPNSKVVITGFKSEIEKILGFIREENKDFNEDRVLKVLSYDTVTNILNINKRHKDFFNKINEIIIPTSKSHSDRVRMIFDRYLPDTKSRLQFVDSKEWEVRYAGVASNIYRVFNPRLLQYTSIATRPMKILKEYSIPLWKSWEEEIITKTGEAIRDVLSQTPEVAKVS